VPDAPERPGRPRRRPRPRTLGFGLVGLAVALQLVPYGRDHENPPIVREPAWDTPATRALVERACFDCHSHATRWPWYSHVAPASWLVQSHVDDGRRHLDFSDWDRRAESLHELQEVIGTEEMPLPGYVALHAEADLSAAERAALLAGLAATLAADPGARVR
jgi:hypothetical protein